MGFDGLFFGRLDYADKKKRMETNTMEMIWAADQTDKTGDSDLFTGALFHAYSPPPGKNITRTKLDQKSSSGFFCYCEKIF